MIGGGRGGFGSRGGVEITHQNDETRRLISIRTARSMALILNAITLCAYLVIWLFWWWILIRAYEPRLGESAVSRWWGCVAFVATEWGRVMGRTWPLWLIPLPLEWPTPLLILYCRNLYPKLLNEHWPPESAQMDPNTSGFVTAANWDERAGIGVPVSAIGTPAREELDVRIEDCTDDPEQPDIAMCLLFSPAGHPGNLARYARALLSTDATRAAFSHAGGKHINGATFYSYTPDEFEQLEIEAVRAGLVGRERGNQPYKLTDRGQFTFARVAERELESVTLSPIERR